MDPQRVSSKKNPFVDGIVGTMPKKMARPARAGSLHSTVYSRGRKTRVVSFVGDTTFHDPYAVSHFGERSLVSRGRTIDSLRRTRISNRAILRIPMMFPTRDLISGVEERFRDIGSDLRAGFSGIRLGISMPNLREFGFPLRLSPEKAMYAPLVGAMALGMVSAVFLEQSFGASVRAGEQQVVYVQSESRVIGEGATVSGDGDVPSDEESVVSELGELVAEDGDRKKLEKRIRMMVEGYPIEDMVPYIVEQDRLVAIFLVSIAKKESDWGRRVPRLDGQDCFNYWGYRGQRKMMGTGGHTCFNSRQDAVETVGKRLKSLIYDNKLDTPAELILWKCGSSCEGHSSYSVRKWISDVSFYYGKLNGE